MNLRFTKTFRYILRPTYDFAAFAELGQVDERVDGIAAGGWRRRVVRVQATPLLPNLRGGGVEGSGVSGAN